MLRRNFLRGSLALAGGLVVGDEVLEAFARLTHQRKSFPSASITRGHWRVVPCPGMPSVTIKWSVRHRDDGVWRPVEPPGAWLL